jgi:hypothetical protein
MNKDFMMGAELALRGAGIQDDRVKQELMSKITNANLAKAAQELQADQDWQKYMQGLTNIGPTTQGASGYVPPGATPQSIVGQPNPQDMMMKAMELSGPEKSAGILSQLTNKKSEPDFYAKELFKAGLKPQEPSFYEKEDYKASLRSKATSSGGSEYAPDIQQYEKPETGEVIPIDVRNQQAVKSAENNGFTLIGPERRGYGVAAGKANAEKEQKVNSESNVARNQVATLKTMDQLLDRFETGKLTKIQMTLQQSANALGLPVNVAQLSDKEAFNAMGEQLALQSRNQGEGMVLAGQMSDRDVQFLRDMNPQLILTTSGNKKLIRIRMALAQRQSDIAKVMRQYKAENKGRFDSTGFEAYMEKNFSKSSVFGIPEGARLIGNDSKTGLPVYQTQDGKMVIPSF